MQSKLIIEFITALQKEIDAVKKGKGGSVARVFNGRLLRESSGHFIYVFHLENFLAVMDDTPAEIEIRGVKYQCQIVSIQSPEIEIAVERNLGNSITEARIQTNLWFLLEMLRQKFEESLADITKFKMSEQLFSGESNLISEDPGEIKYSVLPGKIPNDSQKNAVALSFRNSLAIIWGPPGTGKTTTIAQAVEAHINAGRKVLLVSHANAAVDQALIDVAEHLKDSLYREGKLVRMGICHLQELQDNYPLVILDKIVENPAQTLIQEKTKLTMERERIKDFLSDYDNINNQHNLLQSLNKEKRTVADFLAGLSRQLDKISNNLKQNLELQRQNKEKLVKAKQAGFLKRIFWGLDPAKIQSRIDQLSYLIDADQGKVPELGKKITENNRILHEKEAEYHNLKREIENKLAKFNLTLESLQNQSDGFKKRLDILISRTGEINKQIEQMQRQILFEAKLIATTLTKTFSSRQFPNIPFDVLIIDESSMAPLPYVYWAASKASKAVTIVGDFKQLPPICISEDPKAQKWLGRNIFNFLGIKTVRDARKDKRLILLDTQYRMAPEIANISNQLFYEGLLQNHSSVANLVLDDSLSGSNKLVIVNTSVINSWCCHLSAGGRFNIYQALISATLAGKLLNGAGPDLKIGITTPYRAQARLIHKIIEDRGFLDRVHVDNIHRFQGGEEQVVIIDCVEGPGVSDWTVLDDKRPGSDADLLLNVALTRAKKKIYLIGHCKHLYSSLPRDSIILRVLKLFQETGCEIASAGLVDSYLAADFEKWVDLAMEPSFNSTRFNDILDTEQNFWPVFLHDLKNCFNKVLIVSPFISMSRTGKMMDFLKALVNRGIQLKIYTRPPSQQSRIFSEDAGQAITQLENIGITMAQRKEILQKVAVIDNRIAWEGSLNIFSHFDTGEIMCRIEGEKTIKEIINNLELSEGDSVGDVTKNLCPKCLENGIESSMIVRKSKFGMFLGCSRYPACKHTIDMKNDLRR
jgi:superfamily I DNA and/or RNA helicase